MESGKLKQRLVGAAVLVSLGIIFLPMILQSPDDLRLNTSDEVIPPKPPGLTVKVLPLDVPERRQPQDSPAAAPPAGQAPVDDAPSAAATAPRPDDGQPAADAPVAWVIQVGSFSSSENANALAERLRKRKYAAFVDEVTAGGEHVFRVRVGPELLRSRADRIRDELERTQDLKGIVMRHAVD